MKITKEENIADKIIVGLICLFSILIFIQNHDCTKRCSDCKVVGEPVAIMYTRECEDCGDTIEGDYSLVTQIETEQGLLIGFEYCNTCKYAKDVFIKQ